MGLIEERPEAVEMVGMKWETGRARGTNAWMVNRVRTYRGCVKQPLRMVTGLRFFLRRQGEGRTRHGGCRGEKARKTDCNELSPSLNALLFEYPNPFFQRSVRFVARRLSRFAHRHLGDQFPFAGKIPGFRNGFVDQRIVVLQ